MTTIKTGTRFHAVIADGNSEWEVTRSRGRGVYEAQCLGLDFNGTVKVFTAADIQRSIEMSNFFRKTADESAAFYEGLRLGSIVHYHNSFGQYVRCEVVMGTTVHNDKPHKCLKPLALVGNWRPYDLPRRRPDGSVDMGYHAKSIESGECFEPHFGNIFESGRPGGRGVQNPDPRKLPALDLSVPPMSADEATTAALWKAVQAAQEALSNHEVNDPKARIQAALQALQGAA